MIDCMQKYTKNGFVYLLFQTLVLSLSLSACSGGGEGGEGGAGSTAVITLSWEAPSERVDGSALNLSEIAGYRIYYGSKTSVYSERIDIDDPTVTEVVVQGVFPKGDSFVVMTTIDSDGHESPWSEPELQVSF